ncbi:hypothetical protein [Streptomyces griseosporeus]|uniref:hypothetical protein n=1 Tax=Streptomyces griseosporeus TaxID=1910 RepID=UPI00167DC5D6|nr:hypothetical protein [Streptomyces griseosporeus]GHF46538.1 hypothetical protein GCM10018783_14660 [Streptomyces griseosporeus]
MTRTPSPAQVVFGDEDLDRELAEWLSQNGLELEGPEQLETGRSGGRLVSAYLNVKRGRRTGGVRIVKLVGPSPDAAAEPENHLTALDLRMPGTEEFTERHIVRLDEMSTGRLGDSWVMFQFPAGDGKEDTATLASLGRTPRLPALAAHIVEGVLRGWNPNPTTREKDQLGRPLPLPTGAEFVRGLLGARADDGSALRSWARSCFGTAVTGEEWVTFPDSAHPLPNPLALHGGSTLDRYTLRFVPRGQAHGDLHPGNIMVPVREDASAEDFWLIDLSRFSETAALARDPAHLLVCLIADLYLPHLSGDARDELLVALTADSPECSGPLVPQGLADTVTRVREVWIDWGALPHIGINTVWRQQWFLALQACALMVCTRERYPDTDRRWFFRLAAEACWAYLEKQGVRPPAEAPALTASMAPQSAPRAPQSAPPAPRPASVQALPARLPSGVRQAPPSAGPTVLDMLKEIWDTFERPRRQLPAADSQHALGALAKSIRVRATDLALALTGVPMTASRPQAPQARERVKRTAALLRRVETLAGELELPGQRRTPGPYDDLVRQQPAVTDALLEALDALLDEVGVAAAALSADGP